MTIQEQIEKSNQLFKAADKAGKRVLIAQDVIDRVKRGQYQLSTKAWVESKELKGRNLSESFRDLLVEKDLQCECCIIGAIMLSCVVFQSDITVDDVINENALEYDEIHFGDSADLTGITNIFSQNQIELIETAFALGRGFYYSAPGDRMSDDNNLKKAAEFGGKYENFQNRLIAIMQNIVDNQGQFVP